MIIHQQICDYCGEQIDLPLECEEDSFLNKNKIISKVRGISLDINIFPIKSFENYKRRNTKNSSFTFCGKVCLLEHIKKFITEEGNLEI